MKETTRGTPRPLRIGVLCALWPPHGLGGAELQAQRLARELVHRGHEVHVFIRGPGLWPRTEDREGLRLHQRPVAPLPGLRLGAEIFWAAMQAGRAELDVLLCYMTFNTGLLGYAAQRVGHTPFVIWQRSLTETRMRRRAWLSHVSAFVSTRAAAIWVQAQSLAVSLEREYARAGFGSAWDRLRPQLRVLGNGVDLPPPGNDDEAPPARFLFVGRLVQEKNPFVLIEAARLLSRGEVWIVGTGPLQARMQEAAEGAPVRFLGKQLPEKIPELLRQCRGLVLPSREEGLPNVALEALAHGRPVVATPVGAIPEFLVDGENGCLVPVGDARSLARALEQLLDDGAWRRLAAAAPASVVRFRWPALVDQVEAGLDEVVARFRKS